MNGVSLWVTSQGKRSWFFFKQVLIMDSGGRLSNVEGSFCSTMKKQRQKSLSPYLQEQLVS